MCFNLAKLRSTFLKLYQNCTEYWNDCTLNCVNMLYVWSTTPNVQRALKVTYKLRVLKGSHFRIYSKKHVNRSKSEKSLSRSLNSYLAQLTILVDQVLQGLISIVLQSIWLLRFYNIKRLTIQQATRRFFKKTGLVVQNIRH